MKDQNEFNDMIILKTLEKYDINISIIGLAKLMDIDLIKLFKDKTINCRIEDKNKNIESVSNNLIGILGNFLAYNYFKKKGYKVDTEYALYENNIKTTKADLAFYDENNILNLCEIKTATQIIDCPENYKMFLENDNYDDIQLDIRKYIEIGKKLLFQIEKLKKQTEKVNVIIFSNCYIDNDIRKKLTKLNVNIIELPINIFDIQTKTRNIVIDIYNEFH